ncbi:TPA: hypothetical protein G8O44_004528 [Salmonella enterica]|nr:hypothetical protein [Salmonella enterica]
MTSRLLNLDASGADCFDNIVSLEVFTIICAVYIPIVITISTRLVAPLQHVYSVLLLIEVIVLCGVGAFQFCYALLGFLVRIKQYVETIAVVQYLG